MAYTRRIALKRSSAGRNEKGVARNDSSNPARRKAALKRRPNAERGWPELRVTLDGGGWVLLVVKERLGVTVASCDPFLAAKDVATPLCKPASAGFSDSFAFGTNEDAIVLFSVVAGGREVWGIGRDDGGGVGSVGRSREGSIEAGCPVSLGATEVVRSADAFESSAGNVGNGMRAESFARGEAAASED